MSGDSDTMHRQLRQTNTVWEADTVTQRTAYRWFQKFTEGDYDLSDKPRSGRPSHISADEVRVAIEADPRQTSRDLALQFNCSHTAILKILHNIGKVCKLGVWVPHLLSDEQRLRRVMDCTLLLSEQFINHNIC